MEASSRRILADVLWRANWSGRGPRTEPYVKSTLGQAGRCRCSGAMSFADGMATRVGGYGVGDDGKG